MNSFVSKSVQAAPRLDGNTRSEHQLSVRTRGQGQTRAASFLRAHWVMLLVAVAGGAALAWLSVRLLGEVDWTAIAATAVSTPRSTLGLSLVLVAVSYIALIGYDAYALRIVRSHRLPLRIVALGSFTSYAIGHALGFPLITAGAVRWRIYGNAGLALAEVAGLTAVASVTLWLGMVAVAGLGALVTPETMARIDGMTPTLNVGLGIILLTGLGLFVRWTSTAQHAIGWGGARIRLPSGWATTVPVLLGLVDVSAAAGALWVLLPGAASIAFPAFAAVFALALVLAILSHAPAGLGSFEAIMLLALPSVPAEQLLAALVVWRVTYTLIPFALATTLVLAHEVARPGTRMAQAVRRIRLLAEPFAPAALGVLVFLGGLVLLTSGAIPSDHSRIRALKHLVPLPFAEFSHLVGSTAGVVLLVLSRGLMRRLAAAWTLSAVVLGTGVIVSLAKGFDWEEAVVLAVFLVLLLAFRPAFYRKTGLLAEPLSPTWLATIGLVIGCSIWLGHVAYSDVDYSQQLWWNFSWHDDAARFMRASFATAIIGAGLSLHALINRASAKRGADPLPADDLARALSLAERADAHLALLGDKRFLFHDEGDAFLMYRVQGKSWIAMGDPVGRIDRARDLVWRFLEEVDRHGGFPVFYQVSPALLPMYLDAGLSLVKLGEQARVDLSTFTTEGRAGRDWRAALNRGAREGMEFEIIPASKVRPLLPELKAVSDLWLAEREAGEKGFSGGYWSEDYISKSDVAVVRREDRILAFANIWHGQPGGELTVDLMRHVPGATGVMDLLFVNLLREGKARGYRWFNLGMAPLTGFSGHRLAPSWHKIAAFMAKNGEHLYGFEGLRAYKEKFKPSWEPLYMACPGGWTLPQVLLDVTTLISGGVAKVVGK
jgi:phosphatidylglycerol lysyltransferase